VTRARAVLLVRTGVLAGGVLLLEALCRAGVIDPLTVIPPSEMAASMFELIGSGQITEAATQTFLTVLCAFVLAVALASTWAPRADAQGQTIKIGVLYDHSGPFSAAGSLNCWRGAKMIIDHVNEKGGVLGKYKIVQVDGDGQSKAEVAINEAERLLNVEKVDILAGIYSSAHAVPLAEKVDRQKKFLWITTAIADAVLKDRHLQYTFRPQANGGSFGENSVAYVAHYAPDKLKKAVKDVRAAIIYEDGPYGTGCGEADSDQLAAGHGDGEHAVGHHGEQHEAAGDHRLHDRDRGQGERTHMGPPGRQRDQDSERVERRAKQPDRALHGMAELHRRSLARAPELVEEADHRA